MQISYYSTLKKIQKLQNLKKKKKFCTGWYARNWPVWPVRLVFKPVRNVDISIPVYIPIWYIPVGMADIGTILTTLLMRADIILLFFFQKITKFHFWNEQYTCEQKSHMEKNIKFEKFFFEENKTLEINITQLGLTLQDFSFQVKWCVYLCI